MAEDRIGDSRADAEGPVKRLAHALAVPLLELLAEQPGQSLRCGVIGRPAIPGGILLLPSGPAFMLIERGGQLAHDSCRYCACDGTLY